MTGTGKVFKGQEFIADVQYDHRIVQRFNEGVTSSGPYRIPTGSIIHLRIKPSSAIAAYCSSADMLTLHMSDGKKQNFYATSSNGDCQATGGPY